MNEPTNDEIWRRLQDQRDDMRQLQSETVPLNVWELWRIENGRRLGETDTDISTMRSKFEAFEKESERRFRAAVNLALSSFAFPIIVGIILAVFTLVGGK